MAATGKRRFNFARTLGEHGMFLTSALLLYYFVPVDLSHPHPAIDFAVFTVAFVGLSMLIGRQIRRQLAAGDDPGVRIRSLIVLLYPVVTLFALAYYAMEVHSPGQFTDISTRTDSLYFTVVTLGTVGFGDAHPDGQVAKILTMVQIVFDLLVIGMMISVATSRARVVSWGRGRKDSAEHAETPATGDPEDDRL